MMKARTKAFMCQLKGKEAVIFSIFSTSHLKRRQAVVRATPN